MTIAHSIASLPGSLDVTLERDVRQCLSDGVSLFADIYRPTRGEKFPVILMRTPYDKRQAETATYRHPAWYAARGYLVVIQDTRGRWRSEGDFTPWTHEAQDGYEAVEWAANLPHSNGRVGMYGYSYVGATQLQAALRRPPSLRAISPAMTPSQYFDGCAFNGGAFALAFMASWAAYLGMDSARRGGDDSLTAALHAANVRAPDWFDQLPLNDYLPLRSTELTSYFFDWLAHPTYDDYWRRLSVDEDYTRIDVPAFHLAGWYDVFARGNVRNFDGLRRAAPSERARAGQKLLVGPWYHLPWSPIMGSVDFGPAAKNVADEWQLRWFDQFLRDQDTGVLDAPVTLFLMGANTWIEEGEWPPRGTVFRPFYLRSRGSANSLQGDGFLSEEPPGAEAPDVFIYDPLAPTPSLGGHSCCLPTVVPVGPADQFRAEILSGVLVYTSPPLEKDLGVIGPVSGVLHAATSAIDTDFTMRLCDVSPDGRSINLLEGIIRARYRESLSAPLMVAPGEVCTYHIDLGPIATVFRRGHRIRVNVSSSDFPQWDRNLNTGGPLGAEGAARARVATQVVLHERPYASSITLPTVGS